MDRDVLITSTLKEILGIILSQYQVWNFKCPCHRRCQHCILWAILMVKMRSWAYI